MQIKAPRRASQTHTIFQSSVSHIWGFWVNQKSYKSTCNQTARYWLFFWGGLCTLFIQRAVRNRVLLCNMLHIWQIHINVCSGYVHAFGQISPWFYYIHAKNALGMLVWHNKFFSEEGHNQSMATVSWLQLYSHTNIYFVCPL